MQPRTRIKFCGMTRLQDALYAVALGADAIGLIFYNQSSRYITVNQAKKITAELPAFISKVALFVNPQASEVDNILKQIPIDYLQFHGEETEFFCQQFNKPYIKAVAITADFNWANLANLYPSATALLLDSEKGGSGQSFPWRALPSQLQHKIILAGGLTEENIAKAINIMHPYAVDVSSGIESAKGVKDNAKMLAFIRGVNYADQQNRNSE